MSSIAVLFLLALTLLTPFYVVYKPPYLLIRYFQHRWPEVLFHVRTREKVLALTIDDAPSRETDEILSVLTEYNATATFFVIGGQVDASSAGLLEAVLRQGSELGNHAMHDEPSRDLSSAALLAQMGQVDGMIETAHRQTNAQRRSKLFRPGSGFFSRRMVDVVASAGYRLVLGDVYPHDPFVKLASVNARHILSMARPGGIVICHDRRSWTAPMLRIVLPELRRRGYRVVSISELLTHQP